MKNQYFGDRNDYFKYDLLTFLAEGLSGIDKLTFVWMLTADDSSSDGQFVGYRRGVGRESLFQFLRSSRDKDRGIALLRHYFESAGFPFRYRPYGDSLNMKFRHRDREAYFAGVPAEDLESAVVFLDPDNELAPRSIDPGNGHRYVTLEEMASVFSRIDQHSALVVYQHLPRVHRKLFLYGLYGDLMEKLDCPMPISISDGSVAFLMLAKTKARQGQLASLLAEYTRSNLQVYA